MPQAFSTSSLPPIKTKPQTELLIDDISSIGQPDISLSTIDSPAPTTPHVYGAIHVTKPLKLFLSLLLIVPLYSYYMAVSKKQEPPYPHATITNTSCYYPQDIVFRFGMLIAGSFLTLIYFVVFKWLAMEKKRTDYQGSVNGWLAPLAQLSILGFLAAIGTIDGAGYPDIHSIGAVFFFIVLFLVVVISTIVLRDMHLWDSTVLSRTSYVTKAGLTLYLVLLMTYCLYGLATEGEQNDDDKYVVIMQWNLVYVCLIWLLSFNTEWKHVYLTMVGGSSNKQNSQQKKIDMIIQ